MENARGIDAIWLTQWVAATRRLLANGFWFSFDLGDEVTAMINALDRATTAVSPLPPHAVPISRRLRFALDHAPPAPHITLLRAVAGRLHWRQNANYQDKGFLKRYGYVEFIGPQGYAPCTTLRLGILLLGANTLYDRHAHPASEIYVVLSGRGRFQQSEQPWKSCPPGAFVVHQPLIPHATETREQHVLALYVWRGDVTTPARHIGRESQSRTD